VAEADLQAPVDLSVPSNLILRFGTSRLLKALPLAISVIGVIAILISPAGWAWKISVLAALAGTIICVNVQSRGHYESGTIALFSDGTARLKSADSQQLRANLLENAWTSQWFCVVALIEPESSRHYYCVVCASENVSDEYRRLLRFLHMRTSSPEIHKVNW
jgi:hypothetical protein